MNNWGKDRKELRRLQDQYIEEEFDRHVLPFTQSIQIKQEGGNEAAPCAPGKWEAPKRPQTPYERLQCYKNLCAKLDRREPRSIVEARCILRVAPYVNIIDLIDNARIGSEVRTFRSVGALEEYTFSTGKIVNLGLAKHDEFRSVFLVDFGKGENQRDFFRPGRGDFWRPERNSLEDSHENRSINPNRNSSTNSNEASSIASDRNISTNSDESNLIDSNRSSSINSDEDNSVISDENSSVTSEGYSPIYAGEIDTMDLDENESKISNMQDSISPSQFDARDLDESSPMMQVEDAVSEPNKTDSTNPSENDGQDSAVNNSMDLDKNDSDVSGTMGSLESSSSVQSESIATPSLAEEDASPDVYSGEVTTQRQSRENASPEVQFLGIVPLNKPKGRGQPRKTPLPTTVQPAGVAKRGRGRPRKVPNNLLNSDFFQ